MNYPGKFFLLVCAFCSSAQLLCAGEADERKLGDRAFYADDYLTAVSHYRSARKLSDGNIISESWAQNSLRLGRALLFSGDIAGAKQLLKEFRLRHPMRSAGTLPADILLAEGKFSEAGKLYQALESSDNPEYAAAARFGNGELALKTGKLADAEKIFRELSDFAKHHPEIAIQEAALRELAYTLIHLNRPDEAVKVLTSIPKKKRNINHEILTALAEIRSGKLETFRSDWQQLISRQLRQTDARSYELLTAAADLAVKQNDPALSIELLKGADRFAPDAALRRNIYRQLINLQSKSDPAGAAVTAKRYSEIFPESADRFDIQLATAAILADAGKYADAAALLKDLLAQKEVPQHIRYRATSDGAIFAESANEPALAAKFYHLALIHAPNAGDKLQSSRKYADFLMRKQEYRNAVAVLEQCLKEVASGNDKPAVQFQLLDAAVKAGNLDVVRKMAEALRASSNALFRGRACFELGDLAAKDGNFAVARKEFLMAGTIKDAGKYAAAGQFGAAWMAFQLGDFRNAGIESFQVAVNHPELPQAHQALFLGYRAGREINDENLKQKCADLLKKKYPDSESFAVYALQNAYDRANYERDPAGAIADLEALERQFSGNPEILTEAMIMRAGMLKNSGKPREAMECASAILAGYSSSRAAYQAAMLAGHLCFNQKNLPEALKFFRQAAALRSDGIEHDIAGASAVETMLRMSISNPKLTEEAVNTADDFIGRVKFPSLRVKIRYYRAWALEHAGKNTEALSGYEQLLNEAIQLRSENSPFDLNYCIKGAVAALQMINSSNRRSFYVRGLRIIRQCRTLGLDSKGLDTQLLQSELVKKLSPKNKRR